jgi:hypothetical protein
MSPYALRVASRSVRLPRAVVLHDTIKLGPSRPYKRVNVRGETSAMESQGKPRVKLTRPHSHELHSTAPCYHAECAKKPLWPPSAFRAIALVSDPGVWW